MLKYELVKDKYNTAIEKMNREMEMALKLVSIFNSIPAVCNIIGSSNLTKYASFSRESNLKDMLQAAAEGNVNIDNYSLKDDRTFIKTKHKVCICTKNGFFFFQFNYEGIEIQVEFSLTLTQVLDWLSSYQQIFYEMKYYASDEKEEDSMNKIIEMVYKKK